MSECEWSRFYVIRNAFPCLRVHVIFVHRAVCVLIRAIAKSNKPSQFQRERERWAAGGRGTGSVVEQSCFSMSVFRFQIGLTVINVVQGRYVNLDHHPDFIQSKSRVNTAMKSPNSHSNIHSYTSSPSMHCISMLPVTAFGPCARHNTSTSA